MSAKETLTKETSNNQNDNRETPSEARMRIISDINELIVACQRTKYEEAVLFHQRNKHEGKRLRTQSSPTWSDILRDLCTLVPLLSDEEYALICRLASLCLLAYLMPKTCRFVNEEFRSGGEQTFEREYDMLKKKQAVDKGHCLLSIEAIMDKSPQIRHLPSSQFDPSCVEDEYISSCFWDFLHSGLGPFLSSRPLSHSLSTGQYDIKPNCGCADLLHVLSMAISCDVSTMDQGGYCNIGSDDKGNEVNFPIPNRVKIFIKKRQSEYFQITAVQRAKLVHVVANNLVLPKLHAIQDKGTPLMDGVLHLRAALRSFSISALSSRQLSDAQKGLVTTAKDTECFAYTEMKALVKILSTNRTKRLADQCNCRTCKDAARPRSRELKNQIMRFVDDSPEMQTNGSTHRQRIIHQQSLDNDVCMHCINGDLLCDLILKYNGSRHYADGSFNKQALAEITIAIATLLGEIDCTDNSDEEQIDCASLPTACTIASLLDGARALFYFLLGPGEEKESLDDATKGAQELENGMKDAMLECVLQLLGSRDRCIARASSSLLALACAYEDKVRIEVIIEKTFLTLQRIFRESASFDDYRDIVGVLAKRSSEFAVSMVLHIVELLEGKYVEDCTAIIACLRALWVISIHQPRVVCQHFDRLKEVFDGTESNHKISEQFASICISSYGLNNTSSSDVKCFEIVEETLSGLSPWSKFQLGRLALSTANFQVASSILGEHLSSNISSASSFLWISSLASVAEAESTLYREGCNGIPSALFLLDSALSRVRSMPQENSFQIELLALRKDFLQISAVVSNLCQEMRLTNTIGRSLTRNHLHQRNTSRCCYMLGARYHSLYKRYGLYNCQETRSTLRSQFSLCRFLGDVAALCFSGSQKNPRSLSSSLFQESLDLPQGDTGRFQIQIIQKLRTELIKSFDNSLEPSLCGEILLKILNSIFKSPYPYPKGYTSLKTVPKVQVQVAARDYHTSDQKFSALSLNSECPYRASFGRLLHLRFSGSLPNSLFRKVGVPFSQIIANVSISLGSPLQRDIDAEDTGWHAEKGNEIENSNAIASANMLPSNSFIIDCECPLFQKEGYYHLEVKLLVRDIQCGEYELNTNYSDERFVVRVGTS